jgi:hypothetical protein
MSHGPRIPHCLSQTALLLTFLPFASVRLVVTVRLFPSGATTMRPLVVVLPPFLIPDIGWCRSLDRWDSLKAFCKLTDTRLMTRSASLWPGSSLGVPPGTRSLALPAIAKTTAWLLSLRYTPPDLLRKRKTLVPCSLRASVFSVNSPVSVSTMAMLCCFACRSQPTIFISASFVPSLFGLYRKVYSGRREADVVMSSVMLLAQGFLPDSQFL